MKKILVVAAVTMVIMGMAGGVFAANEVAVSATVQNKCGTIVAGSITDFAIDPDAAAITKTSNLNGTSPSVKCTKGSTVSVTCPAGTQYLTMLGDTPAGDIPYTVTCPAPYGASGFGTADNIDVQIDIAAGAAANSAAGAHTGFITVTVAN